MHSAISLLTRKHNASTCVWNMIDESRWIELRQLLVVEGRVDMLPSAKKRRYHKNTTCRVPLMPYCLASGAPDDIVRVLLEVNEHRQVLSIPDKFGRLPLHIACRSPQVCKFAVADLVVAYPRATIIQDKEGNLPIHYAVLAACRHKVKMPLQSKAETFDTTPESSSGSSCSSWTSSLTDDSTKHRDGLQILNNLLLTAPTSVLVVNNELETPLSLAIRLENGVNGPSENTPAYNIMSSVATTVMHDWEGQQTITNDLINETAGLYDESFLERRKPAILSTTAVVKHFILGR